MLLRVGIRIIIVIIIVTDMCPHPLTHVSRNQEKNTAAPLRISRTFVTLIAIIIPKSMIATMIMKGKTKIWPDIIKMSQVSGFEGVVADRKRRLRRMKDQGRIRTIK
jgi:hypothetical protein